MTDRKLSKTAGGRHDVCNNISISSDDDDDDDDGDSFDDELGAGDEPSGGFSAPYYSSHIAAVCEAVNATRKPSNPHTYGMTKQEKRREANRLSARRCRKRRRQELDELEDEVRRLNSESTELAEANAALRGELQREVQQAQSEAAVASASVVPKWGHVQNTALEGQISNAVLRQHEQRISTSNMPIDRLLEAQALTSARLPEVGLPASLSSTVPLGQALDPSTLALLQAHVLLQSREQGGGALNLALSSQHFQPLSVSTAAANPSLAQLLEARMQYSPESLAYPTLGSLPLCSNPWPPPSSSTALSAAAVQLEVLKRLGSSLGHHHGSKDESGRDFGK
jgi:hypothetical protein